MLPPVDNKLTPVPPVTPTPPILLVDSTVYVVSAPLVTATPFRFNAPLVNSAAPVFFTLTSPPTPLWAESLTTPELENVVLTGTLAPPDRTPAPTLPPADRIMLSATTLPITTSPLAVMLAVLPTT